MDKRGVYVVYVYTKSEWERFAVQQRRAEYSKVGEKILYTIIINLLSKKIL